MRETAKSFLAIAVILLCAAQAGAQSPQPTGMLSPTNPVLFTNDGMPDGNGGDQPGLIEYIPVTTGPSFVQVNFGQTDCNGSPIHGALAYSDGGPFNRFAAGSGEVSIGELDTSDPSHPRPISAAYSQPTEGGGSAGEAEMIDSDGDHRYERMVVQGNKGADPVAAELDLLSYDPNGDGLPEHVTLFDPAGDPDFNLGVLQFFGLDCDGGSYDQAWVPVGRDLDGDPAIIGDLDGNGEADPEFLWGPKLETGVRSLMAIPTLSEVGLVVLATLLLLGGLRAMRRRGVEAGT